MWELERQSPARPDERSVAIVGPGRLGCALTHALAAAGYPVTGPLGRGERRRARAIVLCVPDAQLTAAAAGVAGCAPLVGHTSGATPLAALEPAAAAGAECFGMHPLQTFADRGGSFAGAGCAIAGSSTRALSLARELAAAVGMRPFAIDDSQRAAYHAAASIASNFVVTLLGCAEEVAGLAGIAADEARSLLRPLVEQTVRNWADDGPARALTGPVARGDEATVALQRAAVGHDLRPLFDAFVERTRRLASEREAVAA